VRLQFSDDILLRSEGRDSCAHDLVPEIEGPT
jgi:hypothetical protein